MPHPIQRNLQHFLALGLKTLSITLFTGDDSTNTYLFGIMLSNAQSLSRLLLNHFDRSGVNLKNPINMPNLRHVTLDMVQMGRDISELLVGFLQVQPPLEQLIISFVHSCPTIFLEYLEGRGQSFRVLSLTADCFQSERYWSWLGNCDKLKEFSIVQQIIAPDGQQELKATGVFFLKWLPPSITKLSHKGKWLQK